MLSTLPLPGKQPHTVAFSKNNWQNIIISFVFFFHTVAHFSPNQPGPCTSTQGTLLWVKVFPQYIHTPCSPPHPLPIEFHSYTSLGKKVFSQSCTRSTPLHNSPYAILYLFLSFSNTQCPSRRATVTVSVSMKCMAFFCHFNMTTLRVVFVN